jgi:LysM repeat protein
MVTRDAKIGLLVGLAFILIVGILLSEHITTATTPQQAELARAGASVREAAATPTAPEPKLANLKIDPNPQPAQSVVTRDQLDSPRLPPTAKIELGTPEAGQIKVIRIETPDPVANAVEVKPDTSTSAPPTRNEIAASSERSQAVPVTLAETARQHGMELMALNGDRIVDGGNSINQTLTPEASSPIANGAKVKEYIALPGDSLSRIASRQMGSATPQNQSAIIALNPSLQKDPSKILAGVKYLIPADAWAAAMGGDMVAVENKKPDAEKKPDTKVSDTKIRVYEVKAGDSLWKIAEREVGSSAAMAQIKKLNADLLGDSDVVKTGMKLKLPVKA